VPAVMQLCAVQNCMHVLTQASSCYSPDRLIIPAGEVAARDTSQGRHVCDQVRDPGHTVACVHG
jgi:hypothetical protein